MATTRDVTKVRSEMKEMFGQVPGWVDQMPPVALDGFWTLMRDLQLGETAIPNKYKELIGLAVSGATRCKYCALFHTEAARLFGATDAEIAEASMMSGFTMMASTFLNAQQVDYDDFRKETIDIVAYVRGHAAQPQPSTAQATQAPGHA